MFTRILVPLDGSERAERAIPVAARIARHAGASVLLTRAVVPNYLSLYEPAFGPYPSAVPAMIEQARSESEAYLTRISGQSVLSGLPVETFAVVGIAAASILQVSEEQHADLIVMTSHGRTGITRWVLGSVAHHLARHATIPTLVLRERDEDASEGMLAPSPRVLVTLDGSQAAEAALAPAADLSVALAGAAPSELRLLLVVDKFIASLAAAPVALLIGGSERYLGRVAEQLERDRGAAPRVTWSVTQDTDIAAAILREAGEGTTRADEATPRADVIAIATHGRTGLERWALGSVTERVLQGTKLPLLIVRPRQIATDPSPLLTEHA